MVPTLNNRTDRKKEETLKKIVTVAVELFNQHSFDLVTMEQIANTADIAKGTLYNYFSSKESIINAYLQRTFQDRNKDRITQLQKLPDTRTRLTLLFTLLIEGVLRQKRLFEIFMVYRMKNVTSFQPVTKAEQSGLSLLIHEIVSLGVKNNELKNDLPLVILEDLVEFWLIEAIKPLYLDQKNYDKQKTIDRCVDLFLNGTKKI